MAITALLLKMGSIRKSKEACTFVFEKCIYLLNLSHINILCLHVDEVFTEVAGSTLP
jgi:hypothetical protein